MLPICPARNLALGMRVKPLEPGHHLGTEVADVLSDPTPGRPAVRLPPLLQGARRDLQQLGDLLPGHDLHAALLVHDNEVRRVLPGRPAKTRSNPAQPAVPALEPRRQTVSGTESGTFA